MIIRTQDIGGGYVRRRFSRGTEAMTPGQQLTREEILAFPHANRQSLVDNGYVDIYPPSAEQLAAPRQRFVAGGSFGRFDVYEGRKLNDAPLSKAEALALAALGPDEEPLPGEDPEPGQEKPPVVEPPN